MPEKSSEMGDSSHSRHQSVMPREVLQSLDLKPGLTVVDGTVGGGGHSKLIVPKIGPSGALIGLDRDPMMLKFAASVLNFPNCHLRQSSYANLPDILQELGIESVDRILLDLGYSSDQLEDDQRGFSYDSTGELDLRFDVTQGRPAWQLLEDADEEELVRIFTEWGEEAYSANIARALVSLRTQGKPVRTSQDLSNAILAALPAQARQSARKNPAARVFQALRIAVNEELTHVETALTTTLPNCLKPGGRLVVLTFHSLEDRLVKQAFRGKNSWHILTPRPLTATATEQKLNPRSRSAKLRAATRRSPAS